MAEQRRLTIKDVRPGGRDVVEAQMPGWKPVNVLLLRFVDVQQAHFAAVERFQKQAQPMDTISAITDFQREKELQEVFRMLLRPESKLPADRLFKDADEARAELSLDEVAWWQAKHAELVRAELERRGIEVKVVNGSTDQDL